MIEKVTNVEIRHKNGRKVKDATIKYEDDGSATVRGLKPGTPYTFVAVTALKADPVQPTIKFTTEQPKPKSKGKK